MDDRKRRTSQETPQADPNTPETEDERGTRWDAAREARRRRIAASIIRGDSDRRLRRAQCAAAQGLRNPQVLREAKIIRASARRAHLSAEMERILDRLNRNPDEEIEEGGDES